MPKKTKQQKILAELHRKLLQSSVSQSEDLNPHSDLVKRQNNLAQIKSNASYVFSHPINKKAVITIKTSSIEANYGYIIKDLLRITIFTILALISQGVLYFLLRTR